LCAPPPRFNNCVEGDRRCQSDGRKPDAYLAVELAPKGIRINAIAPGIVETDAVRALFDVDAAGLVRDSGQHNPSGRGVAAADYTKLNALVASPEAEFIQGQVVFVNGGANLSA
jgi:enoyl-[acyl-carrier protein] reductase III